jgi:hypothetical protein
MADLPKAGRFEPGLFGRLGAQKLVGIRWSAEFIRPIVLPFVQVIGRIAKLESVGRQGRGHDLDSVGEIKKAVELR